MGQGSQVVERAPRRAPVLATAYATCLVAYAWVLYSQFDALLSGDARCTYLPTAWGLRDGEGFKSFAYHAHGSLRMPGYVLSLWALSLIPRIDAIEALRIAAVLGVASILGALYLLRDSFRDATLLLAAALLFTTPSFAEAAFQATPDLLGLGLALSGLWLSRSSAPVGLVASGLLTTASTFLRMNNLFAVSFAIARAKPRRPLALAAAAPFVAWSFVSLSAFHRVFWIPHRKGATPGFHTDFVDGFRLPEQLLGANPVMFVLRTAYRGLLSGPIEVVTEAIGIGAGLAWVLCLPMLSKVSRQDKILLFGSLFVAWVLIAPLHFEARYYLFFAAIACLWSAHGLIRLFEENRVVGAILIAWVITAGLKQAVPAYERALATQLGDNRDKAAFERLVTHFPANTDFSADRDTCSFSALSLALRRSSHAGKLTCTGPALGSVYVGKTVPEGWSPIAVPGGPELAASRKE